MGDSSSPSVGPSAAPIRMLIVNPNTTAAMTDALRPVVEGLRFRDIEYTYFTCPAPGIPSINSPADAAESAHLSLPHLLPLLPTHDTILIACYSQHPLVPLLKAECAKLRSSSCPSSSATPKYVTGIFEASLTASLTLLADHESLGIVSTGSIWADALDAAAQDFLGSDFTNAKSRRFAACETTGLNADQLHALPGEVVRGKMVEATKRLLRRGQELEVRAVCLGCAGMVGLEEAVREACVSELGEVGARGVRIVDGVKAGVGILYGLARGGF